MDFTFLEIFFIQSQLLEINGMLKFLYVKCGRGTWVLESEILVSVLTKSMTLVEQIT